MTISKNLLVDKTIDKPNITVVGTSDNCTIEIHNQNNTDITCFRHIKYCFLINGTLLQCFISNISNSLELNYTWNWTSVDLSIEYDIIFARYIFEFNILKCADDEFNTNNFSSPQDTVTDSYNSTTNYSDGADLLTSTHMFPTQLNATNTDQDTTFSTITDADIIKPTATIPATTNPATTDVVSTYLTTTNTTTGILNITDPITSHSTIIDANTTEPIITNLSTIISTENTPMSSSTTTNLTSPPECPEALAKWKIALIAVGPVIGVSLIVGVLGFFIWKRKHSETPKMNFPMHDWSPPQETHVEKPISQPKSYGHNRSVPSETFLSEPDERRHGKRHHHRPKTSEHDEQLQPISLPPLPRSRTRLERMERRRNRRRSRPTNHEETIAMSVNPIHQHQVPRNRPKRLPPLHHD